MSVKKNCLVCGKSQRFAFAKKGFSYFRCPECGLLSLDPLPDPNMIAEHYRRAFEEGNYKSFRKYMVYYMDVYRYFVAELETVLHSYHMKFSGLKVLDVGCFTGELIALLSAKGADVYGLELQQNAIDIANSKLPGRIFKADLSHNNLPQMKFNVVMLMGVIEHVLDPVGLLRNAVDALEPGGILMFQTPDSNSFLSRTLRKYWPPCAPVEHIYLFSQKSLQKKLLAMDLENIRCRPHWKKLPLGYIYSALRAFGPEIFLFVRPLYDVLLNRFSESVMPFYIGEMIVFARKPVEKVS